MAAALVALRARRRAARVPELHPGRAARSTECRRAAPDDVMILMAQAVPDAAAIPCIMPLPTGLDASAASACSAARAGSGSTRTRPGDHAVEVTPASAGGVRGATTRRRCRATSRGCAGSRRSSSCLPSCAPTRTYLSDGAVRDVPLRVRRRPWTRRRRSCSTPRSAFQPRAELVAEVERRSGLVAVRRGRTGVRGESG